MGSNFSKHSRFDGNSHFVRRVADGAACETSRSSTLRRNFELSFITDNGILRGTKMAKICSICYAIGYRKGLMLLLEKLRSMSLPGRRSVWHASRWTLHGNFLSLMCLHENFKSSLQSHNLWNIAPFYIIRLILIACSTLYIVLLEGEVLIGLFTDGLTNNRKNHFFAKSIQEENKKFIFPPSHFLNRSGQTVASCEFFAKCSCGGSVGLSHGSRGAETGIKVDGARPRVVIIYTRRDAVKRRVCPSIK